MQPSWSAVALVVAATALSCTSVKAPQLHGVAYEFVDHEGELVTIPAQNVTVSVAGHPELTGATDRTGAFAISVPADGDFSLRANADAYVAAGTVQLAAGTTEANVYLVRPQLLIRMAGSEAQWPTPFPTNPLFNGKVDLAQGGAFLARIVDRTTQFPLGGARVGIVGKQPLAVVYGRGPKTTAPSGGGALLHGLSGEQTVHVVAHGYDVPDVRADFVPGVLIATEIDARPAPAVPATSLSPVQFVDQTREAGINFSYANDPTNEFYGPGVVARDLNGDGFVDLFFTNTPIDHHRLYLNDGTGHFIDASATSGIDQPKPGRGACAGDIDNDGKPELFVISSCGTGGHSVLYHNDGGGHFSVIPGVQGVEGTSFGCAFADVDNDGYLDLAVAGSNSCSLDGRADVVIYRNNHDGTMSEAYHLLDRNSPWAFEPVFVDYNRDHLPDLVITRVFSNARIFQNVSQPGQISFKETTDTILPGHSQYDVPSAVTVGDYDNDGYDDLFISTAADLRIPFAGPLPQLSRNVLAHWNPGLGRFERKEYEAGVADTGWAFGNDFTDVDNDGLPDLYVVGNHFQYFYGYVQAGIQQAAQIPEFGQPIPGGINGRHTTLFLNKGNGTFADITSAAGIDDPLESKGLAVADLDGNGFPDLIVTNNLDSPALYYNGGNGNHWLGVLLHGTLSNRDAIGAVVTITIGGARQRRVIQAGSSYVSQSDIRAWFGLGANAGVDAIDVEFPSGTLMHLGATPGDQVIEITETP